MPGIRVPLHGNPTKYAVIERDATIGAVVGLNLLWPDGSLVTEDEFEKAVAAGSSSPATTTGIPQVPSGGYTDAQADARVEAGIAEHVAEDDPHEQYVTADDLAAALADIRPVLPMVTGAIVSGQPEFLYDPDDGTLIYAEV